MHHDGVAAAAAAALAGDDQHQQPHQAAARDIAVARHAHVGTRVLRDGIEELHQRATDDDDDEREHEDDDDDDWSTSERSAGAGGVMVHRTRCHVRHRVTDVYTAPHARSLLTEFTSRPAVTRCPAAAAN